MTMNFPIVTFLLVRTHIFVEVEPMKSLRVPQSSKVLILISETRSLHTEQDVKLDHNTYIMG